MTRVQAVVFISSLVLVFAGLAIFMPAKLYNPHVSLVTVRIVQFQFSQFSQVPDFFFTFNKNFLKKYLSGLLQSVNKDIARTKRKCSIAQ